MLKKFKNMQQFRAAESEFWQDDWLIEKYQQLNDRFEDRVLYAATVRDEIRRGVRQSDEQIEVSLYAWIARFTSKVARYARLYDVEIADIKGDIVFDLLEQTAQFEPIMTAQQFWQVLAKQQPATLTLKTDIVEQLSENQAQLIKNGVKTLTATPQAVYQAKAQAQPKVGDIKLVLYPNGNVCCAVQTTQVDIVPFEKVSRMQAYQAADGDRSLDYWKATRQLFFKRALQPYNLQFDDMMPILLESYQTIATPYDLVYNKLNK